MKTPRSALPPGWSSSPEPRGPAWWAFGMQWEHIDWLVEHPEHIDFERPSEMEEVAIWRIHTGDASGLPQGVYESLVPRLEDFDKPWHREHVKCEPDPGHAWLRHIIEHRFGGFEPLPPPEALREYLRAPALEAYPDGYPRRVLRKFFSTMATDDMDALRDPEGMTFCEIARALRNSGFRSSVLGWWFTNAGAIYPRPRYLDALPADLRALGPY